MNTGMFMYLYGERVKRKYEVLSKLINVTDIALYKT